MLAALAGDEHSYYGAALKADREHRHTPTSEEVAEANQHLSPIFDQYK